MKTNIVGLVVVAACGSSGSSGDPPPAPKVVPIPVQSAPEPPRKPSIERRLYPIDVVASSFLEADTRPYVQYHPSYAVDGDPKTAWNEGAPGAGEGEWLGFAVTKQEGVSKVRLRVANGFQYNDAVYKANPRAKTVEVRLLPKGKTQRAVLADQTAWQEITLSTEMPVLEGIELTVVDVYPGAKFKDLAISEVEIYVTSQTPEKPDVEKAHLDAIVAWKKQQRAMAELMTMPSPNVVVVPGEIDMPAAATPFVERADWTRRSALSGASELVASVKGDDVTAASVQDCLADGFHISCLAQLYTTSGVKVTMKDATPRCRPRLMGSVVNEQPIGELVISTCVDHSTRAGPDIVEAPGVVLEYDDDAQLRVAMTDKLTAYFEWGQVDGKRTIVRGAVTELVGDRSRTNALIGSDK